jgi:hypothetical protein
MPAADLRPGIAAEKSRRRHQRFSNSHQLQLSKPVTRFQKKP